MRFGDLVRVPNTKMNGLFDHELCEGQAARGWIDVVQPSDYPKLDDMLERVRRHTQDIVPVRPFRMPRSWDDFDLVRDFQKFFGDRYASFVEQWTPSWDEIVRDQCEIHTSLKDLLPRENAYYIYLFVSEADGVERVIYVGQSAPGKKRHGLVTRILNGTPPPPKRDDHLGGCLAKWTPGASGALKWRAQSAELRRRGLNKIVYLGAHKDWTDELEADLIKLKLATVVGRAPGRVFRYDPANLFLGKRAAMTPK